MIDQSKLPEVADELTHLIVKRFPDAELYEQGALLMSIGAYLTASCIPGLWPQLRGTASLAHELLLNTQTKEKLNVKAE